MIKTWKIKKIDPDVRAVSDILNSILNNDNQYFTLQDIEYSLGSRGFSLMLLLFSLPLAIPIPVPPGFTTFASIPLIIFSMQMILGGKHPWIPKWLAKKNIKRSTIETLVKKANFFFYKIEKISRKRFSIFDNCVAEFLLKIFYLTCAVSIANPIPLTNMIPAIGIIIVSFGSINQDGVIVSIGLILGIIGLIISFWVTFIGSSFLLKFL